MWNKVLRRKRESHASGGLLDKLDETKKTCWVADEAPRAKTNDKLDARTMLYQLLCDHVTRYFPMKKQ